MFGLKLCCHHLEIFNDLDQQATLFHFAQGPACSWSSIMYTALALGIQWSTKQMCFLLLQSFQISGRSGH